MMATRGQRRHIVTLKNPTGPAVPDGDGGYTHDYEAFATRAAEIKVATVRDLERVTASTVVSMESKILTMDFHQLATTGTRLEWTDTVGRAHAASVTSVNNPDERCIDMILVAVEVV